MVEKLNTSNISLENTESDISSLQLSIWDKVFYLINIREEISSFVSEYINEIFIKDTWVDNQSSNTLELDPSVLLILSKKLGIKLNDFIHNNEIRLFLKSELWLKKTDRFFVKDNKIFIVERKISEPRFKWFNKIQLNNIVSKVDIFKWSKEEFINNSIIRNLHFEYLTDEELHLFLTSDFKRFINDAIIKSIIEDINDLPLADWMASFIYREHFDEINLIISSRLERTLKEKDYLWASPELKNKILNYFDIYDDLLIEIASNILGKFKTSFSRLFLTWILPDQAEIEKYHLSLENKLKKNFIIELKKVFNNKIWLDINNALLDSILNNIYDEKRDNIRYWLSKYLVDLIYKNLSWTSIPNKVYKFFSYYSWDTQIWSYPEFKLNSLNSNWKNSREIFNDLCNFLLNFRKIKTDLDKLYIIKEKYTREKSSFKKKINELESNIQDLQSELDLIDLKISNYNLQICSLEKDFFSKKKILNIKEKMKEEDIISKQSTYNFKIRQYNSDLLTLKAREKQLPDYSKKIHVYEQGNIKNINIYEWIIEDLSKIIFEIKKQA